MKTIKFFTHAIALADSLSKRAMPKAHGMRSPPFIPSSEKKRYLGDRTFQKCVD